MKTYSLQHAGLLHVTEKMNTDMMTHIHYNTMISDKDLKQRKVLFLIADEENTYKPYLEAILRKSHALNIKWKIIIRDAVDGRLITLIKPEDYDGLIEGGWEP